MKQYPRSSLSRGLTLVETAIALAVAGLVVGAIWSAGAKASRSAEIALAGERLYRIIDNVRGLYISRAGIFTDNTQAIVNGAACGAANFNSRLSCLGGYPTELLLPAGLGNPAYHAWDQAAAGGSIQIIPRDINLAGAGVAPGVNAFGVQYRNLPVDVCIKLASYYSTPDQKLNLKAVVFFDAAGGVQTVYATPTQPPDWTLGGARPPLPVTVGQAAAECATASAVEWIASLR